MDEIGCKRYCCRRMVLTHVDLIEKLLLYTSESTSLARDGQKLTCPVVQERSSLPASATAIIPEDQTQVQDLTGE